MATGTIIHLGLHKAASTFPRGIPPCFANGINSNANDICVGLIGQSRAFTQFFD